MPSPLKTLIIGCGRIGALADKPGSDHILTHAHAIHTLPKCFELIGFMDPNPLALNTAAQRWGGKTFAGFESLAASGLQPDVIVISSPDDMHFEQIKHSLALNPKAIIVEKPISKTLMELQRFSQSNGQGSVKIAVNYTRRFMPIHQTLLRRLGQNEFGKFLHGSAAYSKGVFHSGSHVINLILPLLSRPIDTITYLNERNDFSADDPTIDCVIKYTDSSYFLMKSVDSKLYELFELELFFEAGRIRIDNKGYRVSYDFPKVYNPETGIKYIEPYEAFEEKDLNQAFTNLYENVFESVNNGTKIICDIQDSITTLTLCERLRRKL